MGGKRNKEREEARESGEKKRKKKKKLRIIDKFVLKLTTKYSM